MGLDVNKCTFIFVKVFIIGTKYSMTPEMAKVMVAFLMKLDIF